MTKEISVWLCFENINIKNRNFIENNTALKEAVAAYFIENDYSKPAINFVGTMMKQYRTNLDFWPDPKYYVSYDGITSIPCPWDFSDRKESNIICDARARYPVFQNANRKDLALEIMFKLEALRDGFLNFGDVIAALYSGSSYGGKKGYIIRNAFNANGFSIPSGLSNKTLETYFYFKKNAYGDLLGIYFKPGLGEFLFDNGISLQEFLDEYWENIEETANNDCEIGKAKDSNGNCVACVDKDVFGNCTKITWVRDADNDNYYAAGSERKEYASWTAATGFKKKSDAVGVDCDDTNPNKTTDCSKCDNRYTEPLPDGCNAITCPWNNNTCNWELAKPCEGDPISNPEIAPQTNSGVNGGRYGYTRSGGNQFHGGLDVKAEYGDPIYAMFDGNASSISQYYNGAGWIVYQTAVIDGESVSIQYFHLQESGRFTGGVQAGDIIGYQGDSGNLDDAIEQGLSESHLHIKMKDSNGNTVNPEDYLKTTFDSEGNPTNNCD